MRDEAPSRARTGQVPQDEATILAARCEAHAIGTEGEARDGPRVAVPAEQADAFGLLDVPHTDRGVVRARCDVRDVWVEGAAAHVRKVVGEQPDGLRQIGSPHAQGAVEAGRRKVRPNRREGHAPNWREMRVIAHEARALQHPPQPGRAILRAAHLMREAIQSM